MIDPSIFLEDYLIAQEDLSTPADFDDFTVDCIFQKVNEKESVLLEGIESNTVAVAYISIEELGSEEIEIGDTCIIKQNSYRVLSISPYTHGQFTRYELTDLNS